jgi:aldehyde:ferredoxin oxidoreductase
MERPEFESMVIWGPKCGSRDGREVVYLHNLCNEYGLDSIEAGNMIAFAIDLFEHGILSQKQTDGLELRWGNIAAMEALLKQIVYRSSWLGRTLSHGIRSAVSMIGTAAEEYAFAVKGLTLTGMDPRGFKASALGYAVSARGGDYTQVYASHEYTMTPEKALQKYGTEKAADRLSEEGKALMVRWCMSSTAIIDSIGLCKIPQLSCLVDNTVGILVKLLREVIQLEFSTDELFKIGERIINAERLFGCKFGATHQDDTLPEKFLKEPIASGASQGSVVNLDLMLQEYYALMGWDSHGNITPAKLQELGLKEYC